MDLHPSIKYFVDFMSLLFFLIVFDSYYLGVIPYPPEIPSFHSLTTFILLPYVAFSIIYRAHNFINSKAMRNPIVMIISRNHIKVLSSSGHSATHDKTHFSSESSLIHDPKAFETAQSAVISDFYKDSKLLNIKPYVIVAPKVHVSHLEQSTIIKILESNNALHVQFVDSEFDINNPVSFSTANPPPSLL